MLENMDGREWWIRRQWDILNFVDTFIPCILLTRQIWSWYAWSIENHHVLSSQFPMWRSHKAGGSCPSACGVTASWSVGARYTCSMKDAKVPISSEFLDKKSWQIYLKVVWRFVALNRHFQSLWSVTKRFVPMSVNNFGKICSLNKNCTDGPLLKDMFSEASHSKLPRIGNLFPKFFKMKNETKRNETKHNEMKRNKQNKQNKRNETKQTKQTKQTKETKQTKQTKQTKETKQAKETNKETNKQTNKQASKETNKQTNKQQANNQTNKQTNSKQTTKQTNSKQTTNQTNKSSKINTTSFWVTHYQPRSVGWYPNLWRWSARWLVVPGHQNGSF